MCMMSWWLRKETCVERVMIINPFVSENIYRCKMSKARVYKIIQLWIYLGIGYFAKNKKKNNKKFTIYKIFIVYMLKYTVHR